MSNIKWEAGFSYKANIGEANHLGARIHWIHSIPVMEFSVKGGTTRAINLESSDATSVMLELEQARAHKNLSLALVLTNYWKEVQVDNPNFYWVYDLLEIAASNLLISTEFVITGRVGDTITQSSRLLCKNAKITQTERPASPGGPDYRVIVVRLEAQTVELIQGSYPKSRFLEAE